ncbi:MAG: DUF1028 domain-containing protein [Betaproteobacteria bacterium]
MTWSIIARDASGALGVAVSSRFFAVGALCPFAKSGVGALSTQALCNPLYGAEALAALERGRAPAAIVAALVAADAGRDQRQLHLIDATGRIGQHTGHACVDWAGHLARNGFSVAGNMLAGPEVLEQTAQRYEAEAGTPFALRLIRALQAGEAAGGDKRGKQAAALLIYTTEAYPALDLRVDDHAEPLQELERLHEKSLDRYQAFVSCLPSAAHPAGITERATIEATIERFRSKHIASHR